MEISDRAKGEGLQIPLFNAAGLQIRPNGDSSNGAATGAIGFYGSSSDPFWIESIWGEIAFNHMLVYGTASSFGQLCYSSSISMLNQIDESDKYLILFWNYLGDPSLAIIPNIFEAVDY